MTHPYVSEAYAKSFAPLMQPVHLKASDAWILSRPIPGTEACDLMGCYPIMPVFAAAALKEDMEAMASHGYVSFVAVSDIFFQTPDTDLFDQVAVYKPHYVYECVAPPGQYNTHHRYEVRRANRLCTVRRILLADHLDAWCALYDMLIARHHITGIQRFSRSYFESLSRLEGVTMFGAFENEVLISAHLWIRHEGYVYSHLAASNEAGYRVRAPYAIYDEVLAYFYAEKCKAIDLGGGAGVNEASKGLSFFKQGFANTTRDCYLYGKILTPTRYEALSKGRTTSFFPAYR